MLAPIIAPVNGCALEVAMLKDVLVHLPVGSSSSAVANYAVSVARQFDSHLTGVAVAYRPVVSGMSYGAIPTDVIAWQQQESEKLASAALDTLTAAAKRGGINFATQTFNAVPGEAGDLFGEIARRFDLAIVPQPDPQNPAYDDIVLEGALFGSGRPMLVVPYIERGDAKFERIVICWDGSLTAARAIGDAMPFLKKAKSIDVLMVINDRVKSDEVPGADIGQHLARHKLPVELHRISTAKGMDVFSTILSYIGDRGADLIVMGGYGHSRLREFILGGVTRGIIGSMTAPVLMAH